MIIGIDASRANRQHKTGTEWYSFYLIKSLLEIDQQNQYIFYLDKEPQPDLAAILAKQPRARYQVLTWPFAFFWTLGRLSWEMLWHAPEVLFVPAHGLPLIRPRRSVNTIHDIAFMRNQRVYRDDITKIKNKFYRRLLQSFVRFLTFGRYHASSLDYLRWSTIHALKKATAIITVSEFTKQEILSSYPWAKAAKITAVHNGYSDEYRRLEVSEPMTAVLNKYGLEKPFILYVGRLENKKNTPFLIEAFSIMRENNPSLKEKLVLIGNASYGYDEVKYVIEEFDLNKEVIMPGWVEEADLPLIFNAAVAFVFPTKYEGFGIPVLQALACGLPTAVSDIPVLHEVADDAVIYFDQDDRNDIARALDLIVSDQSLRAKLVQIGPEQAKKFSWQQCARETLAVIENLK